MDKKINLILALHNHQPEGNLPEVFERTFREAYEPFIAELERFPRIKITLHYSGILLRWLAENKPAFLCRLRDLINRGQVEMMGGAFYEPILVMIPDEDKIGQIRKQSHFIRENFQSDVIGVWLPERVWEPHLASPLHRAGIRYTVLDDAHFRHIGFTEEEALHYFITEESGDPLSVFPISEKLRYLIPFAAPEETIKYLGDMATSGGDRVVVLADDGEKFGSWPGTNRLVYGENWLSRFFAGLQENSSWLRVTTFKEFINSYAPAGRVYLPAGSYREMMEWSGGFWRNFLRRYPESNQIHKKMLHIRQKLSKLPEGPGKQESWENLWAGQCNCAYWHGVFGGIYLNFLRSALYSRLITAETLAEQQLYGSGDWIRVEEKDFDYDGAAEIMVSGPELSFVVAPRAGGALMELDFKPRRFNLLDVLTRRPEAYHCNIIEMAKGECPADDDVKTIHHIALAKEAGLEQFLIYDDYRRMSCLDHFFDPRTAFFDTAAGLSRVEAGNFVTADYAVRNKTAGGPVRISLAGNGTVSLGGRSWPVKVGKTLSYAPNTGELRYDYILENSGGQPLSALFAVEFNISFLAGHAPDRYYTWPGHSIKDKMLDSRGELVQVKEFGLVDEWLGMSTLFRFERPATIWRMPIETVSQSEAGMERVYQGSTLLPIWPVILQPGEPLALSFSQKITELLREVH